MSFWFQDDTSVINRVKNNQAARQYRASQAMAAVQQPDWVALLNDYYDAFPELDSEVAIGLAKSGVRPNSAEAQDIIRNAVVMQALEAKGWGDGGGLMSQVGDVLHPVADTIGKVLSPVGKAADFALGGVDETLSPVLRGAVRTGMVVLESGLQELQTYARAHLAASWEDFRDIDSLGDVVDYVNPLGHRVNETNKNLLIEHVGGGGSSAYQSIDALIKGEDVEVGSGFLPAGEFAEQRKKAAGLVKLDVNGVQYGGPGHEALSPGRFVASFVTEPGTEPYKIVSGLTDAGVAWFGDPTLHVGAALKEAQAGARLRRGVNAFLDDSLDAARAEVRQSPTFVDNLPGLADGRVPGVRPTTLPDETEWWLDKQMQRVVGRIADEPSALAIDEATKQQLPARLLGPLAAADTPEAVASILRDEIGGAIRQRPEYLGFKAKRAYGNSVRLRETMPGAFVDPGDLRALLTGTDDFLRNAKASAELRRSTFDRLAASPPGREEVVSVLSDVRGQLAEELVNKARPLGAKPISPQRARALTAMADAEVDRARAFFIDEIAANDRAAGLMVGDRMIDATDPHLLTEFVNNLVPMGDAREIRRATSTFARLVDNPFWEGGVDALNGLQGKWKQLALLRGAYTVRVIGEEQIRMAASGLDSTFAHPISFISALIADPAETMTKMRGRLRQADVTGQAFVDEFGNVVAPEMQAALNNGWAGWAGDEVFDKSFRLFEPGKDEGFTRAWAQVIGRSHDEPLLREIAANHGSLDQVSNWYWDGLGQWHRKRLIEAHPELATRDGADAYLAKVKRGLDYRTNGDPLLYNAVATGAWNGKRIGKANEFGRWNLDPDFVEALASMPNKPAAIQGQALLRSRQSAQLWDNATGWAFSHLMTKPTNYLSRSSSFRQFYWNRVEEMMPFLDDATRAQVLRNAENVVDSKQFTRMAQAKAAPSTTLDSLDDVDLLAKSYGLNETKKLLYDLSEKGQFFDTFRLIFPFGEAWKEVLTRWANIGLDNPKVIRKAQLLIDGARGNGFFHKDVNGEEVFNYPGSRWLAQSVTGIPFDLTGRVAGLSLMTDVAPGVGPLVQLSAAALLPETPDWNWVRNIVSPYGEQDYSGGILESFLPGYAKNIAQFFQKGDPRMYANTVMSVQDYLASTGDYDLKNDADVRRLIDDAKETAKHVYLLRGMVQFGAPTAPRPEFLVETKDGDLDVARVVLEDLQKMQEEDYDSAVGRFLDKYGTDAMVMLKGKSISIPAILPTSKASAEWRKNNAGVAKDYPNVWGIFAPQDDEDFDYVEYVRQFKSGDRFSLTPEQRVSLAQARVGRYIYEQAKTKVGDKPSKSEREWLAVVKERIRLDYPGYGEMVGGLPSTIDNETTIENLRKAVVDPRLKDTDQAKAIRLYLEGRDRAIAWANELGVKTLSSQAAEPARLWLGRIGAYLAKKYPSFQQPFDIVFSQEVE